MRRWRDGNPSFVELVNFSAIMVVHGGVLPLGGVFAGDHVLARPLDGAVGNPQNEDGIDQGAIGISHVMEKIHRRSVAMMILLSSEEDRCCSWRCQRRPSPPDRSEAAGARTARSS